MNNEFSDLEKELRLLSPIPTPCRLEEAIATKLGDRESPRFQPPARPWWQRLGFNAMTPALAWPAALAAAVVLGTLAAHEPGPQRQGPHTPESKVATMPHGDITAVAAVARTIDSLLPVDAEAASSVLYEAKDEGLVLNEGQQPARRVRYRSEDTLQWRNPDTGAQLEISYPREDVVLVPVHTQ